MRTMLRIIVACFSWIAVRIHLLLEHRRCCGPHGMAAMRIPPPEVSAEMLNEYNAWRTTHMHDRHVPIPVAFAQLHSAVLAGKSPIHGYVCVSCGYSRFQALRLLFFRRMRSMFRVAIHQRDNEQCLSHGIKAATEINAHGLDRLTIKRYVAWRETQRSRGVKEDLPKEFIEVHAAFKTGTITHYSCGGCSFDG